MSPEDGRVVSSFIVQALKGRPLTIFGDGSQSRSFCYVDDLVEALILLMNSPAAVTGPINLGNPEELSMNKLANAVLDATGSSSSIEYAALPVDDPRHRRPDITLALEHLHWKPRVGFTEGLARTIRYLEKQIEEDQTA